MSDINKRNEDGFREGTWEFLQNGKLYHRNNYKDGLRHGEYCEFFPNGQVCYIKNFVNGILHGYYISNFENGEVEFCGNYRMGNKIGFWNFTAYKTKMYYLWVI